MSENRIYILQMYSRTMPSRLVRLFTRYPYSHVALSLDERCDILYSFGRKRVEALWDGGFVTAEKDGAFFRKYGDTVCRIYELEVTGAQFCRLQAMLEDMQRHRGQYKYDFLGAGLRFFGIPVTFKNKYVCSYFVAELLENAEIHHFRKRPPFVQPKDFEALAGASAVYTGQYTAY